MEVILDQVIITKKLHDNITKYINKPRKALDAFPSNTFVKFDIGNGEFFTRQLFNERVHEAMEALRDYEYVREESVLITPNIQTYEDNQEDISRMTLNIVITENNQIFIVAMEDDVDDPQDGYWAGIAYYGEQHMFYTIMSELGIDITSAINGDLLPSQIP